MYSIAAYGTMISDRGRMKAYRAALTQAIRPGSVVIDIGCGTGIFSLIACELGASRVYAIDPDDSIELARKVAADNGYGDRIVCIRDRSDRIELPEKADVIVSDLRGVVPLFGHHIPAIIDARQRLLAPGGALIPQRDDLWAALVEVPDVYRRLFNGWRDKSHAFNMTAARNRVANTWIRTRVEPSQVLGDPQCWASLEYHTVTSPHVSTELTWTVGRPGLVSGLAVWFDGHLLDGVTMSNAPSATEHVYGNAFFPWPEQVQVAEGERVHVAIAARLIGGDYVWRWNSTVFEAGPDNRVKVRFQQSTFAGGLIAPGAMSTRADTFVPQLDDAGQFDRWVLGAMDGAATVGDIARAAMERFPGRFATAVEALGAVGELATRYSRKVDAAPYRRR